MSDATAERAAILVVDDRPDQLLALDAILAPLGEPVVHATSGEDALRELLRGSFAVILLDVRLAGISGLETAELIKSRERTRYIPIIFMTGVDNREQTAIMRAYSAGAVDFVFKPFEPEVLRSKVAVFVDLFRQQRRLADQEHRLRDAERQQLDLEHAHELLQSEAKYREILEAALDAIIITDTDGRVAMMNHAAEDMFGESAATAVGAAVTRFFDTHDEQFYVDGCDKPGEMGRESSEERPGSPRAYTGRRANGDLFPIEMSVSCLESDDRRSYTLIVRDVSERVRQAEALRAAMSARSRFLASMSHELRTPINAVLGYNSLLIDGLYGELNQEQLQGIERSQKATRHLLDLVNDILDLSKIEAGKVDIATEPVRVPDIISDIFVTVQPLADEHGSTLALESTAEAATINSDARRLRQILLNLLSNAIKFGEGKPIRAVYGRTDRGDVVIDIIDRGPGIAPSDQDRIFREFEQLNQVSRQSGTGLGLPISRRLAEALKGSLTVDSKPGEGSTFRLTIPAEPSNSQS
jgi:PAS domain S-box-containing protein